MLNTKPHSDPHKHICSYNAWGGGTPCSELYGEAPLERHAFFYACSIKKDSNICNFITWGICRGFQNTLYMFSEMGISLIIQVFRRDAQFGQQLQGKDYESFVVAMFE